MDDNAWIQLNIGGKVFETTRKTLCRDPESFLARLDGDDSALPRRKDKKGAYVIDREPENFAVILHYLRTGFLKVPDGVTREELVEEAEFYNLVALVKLIEDTSFKKPSVEYFTVARYPQEHRVQLAMSESPKDCTSIVSEIRSKGLDVRESGGRYYLVESAKFERALSHGFAGYGYAPGYTWAEIHAKLWPVLLANDFKLEKEEEPNSWTFVRTVKK